MLDEVEAGTSELNATAIAIPVALAPSITHAAQHITGTVGFHWRFDCFNHGTGVSEVDICPGFHKPAAGWYGIAMTPTHHHDTDSSFRLPSFGMAPPAACCILTHGQVNVSTTSQDKTRDLCDGNRCKFALAHMLLNQPQADSDDEATVGIAPVSLVQILADGIVVLANGMIGFDAARKNRFH